MNNPFWDFSLASYAIDEVATSALALQDEFNLDVNLLLYGAWLGAQDRQLSASHLAGVEAVAMPWREQVVRPLRNLRREWRDYHEAGAIRREIKALELQAEQRQQDMMLAFFRTAPDLSRAPRPVYDNLVMVVQLGCPENDDWVPAIGRLASLLGN